MDVSVILVNYNTKDVTRDCLKSVYQHTRDIEFEVFVVDNNSQDGSCEMIEQEFPQVKLIKNPENRGFGAANNLAVRQSSGKYVFFLNTDTVLLGNSVRQFYDFMEKEENQKIGAAGGFLYFEDMTPGCCGGGFFSVKSSLFRLLKLHHIFKQYAKKIAPKQEYSDDRTTPFEIDCVIGADLFVRKSVLDEIGIFDEDFFLYHEDMDLCYRIKKAGYKNVIFPQVKIIHKEGKSGDSTKRFCISSRAQCFYYSKHYGIIPAFFVFLVGLCRYKKMFFEMWPKGYKIFK